MPNSRCYVFDCQYAARTIYQFGRQSHTSGISNQLVTLARSRAVLIGSDQAAVLVRYLLRGLQSPKNLQMRCKGKSRASDSRNLQHIAS